MTSRANGAGRTLPALLVWRGTESTVEGARAAGPKESLANGRPSYFRWSEVGDVFFDYYANGRSNVPAPGISIDGEVGAFDDFSEVDQST